MISDGSGSAPGNQHEPEAIDLERVQFYLRTSR
jgi:hypothetical protein